MNLTYQTIIRSCYKPGEISIARWKRTSPETHLENEAFRVRHEVLRKETRDENRYHVTRSMWTAAYW